MERSDERASDKPVNGTNKIPIWETGHAMSFKVCNGEEGVKIHLSDTGIGIDYFVWWEGGVMQTSGISEEYLSVHHTYYLGMSDSCFNDYPTVANRLSFPNRWNYNLYGEATELEWLPISLSKRFPQTVETETVDLPYIEGMHKIDPGPWELKEALELLKKLLKKYGMDERESTLLLKEHETKILKKMQVVELDEDGGQYYSTFNGLI